MRRWWRRWFYRNIYLRLPWWRFVRWVKLRQHGMWCDNCGRRFRSLDVHHPYYNGLIYRELWQLDRLQVLCRGCHNVVHGMRHE